MGMLHFQSFFNKVPVKNYFWPQAHDAQVVQNVLDQTYAPTTSEEDELFDEKQKYFYAILEDKVLTDHRRILLVLMSLPIVPKLFTSNFNNTT